MTQKNNKTFLIQVEQNGGEYYGLVTIKSAGESYELKDNKTVVIDGVQIEFDERIEILRIR